MKKEPKTKWQLAVAIEEQARAIGYSPWGHKCNRTVNYNYFTKEELKREYEELKAETGL